MMPACPPSRRSSGSSADSSHAERSSVTGSSSLWSLSIAAASAVERSRGDSSLGGGDPSAGGPSARSTASSTVAMASTLALYAKKAGYPSRASRAVRTAERDSLVGEGIDVPTHGTPSNEFSRRPEATRRRRTAGQTVGSGRLFPEGTQPDGRPESFSPPERRFETG